MNFGNIHKNNSIRLDRVVYFFGKRPKCARSTQIPELDASKCSVCGWLSASYGIKQDKRFEEKPKRNKRRSRSSHLVLSGQLNFLSRGGEV